MAQQQNGFEYAQKDGEVPFWLEDITKYVFRAVNTTQNLINEGDVVDRGNFEYNALSDFRLKVTHPNKTVEYTLKTYSCRYSRLIPPLRWTSLVLQGDERNSY